MGKKGLATVEILSIIFVPGVLTVFLVTKLYKLLNKIAPQKFKPFEPKLLTK